jgi:hypothetical protein
MQGYRPIIAINIVVLLILCVFVVYFAECHGSAGRGTAGNVATEESVAKDAAGKATTGSDAAAVAGATVTVTAIAGSSNVILNLFGEEIVTATPFYRDLRAEDDASDLVKMHRCMDLNEFPYAMELYDGATGKLWALSMNMQDAYEVEEIYLDPMHNQLIFKAIRKRGEPASWGHFTETDAFLSTMQQGKKLVLTTGDGTRQIFVLAGSAEFLGQ